MLSMSAPIQGLHGDNADFGAGRSLGSSAVDGCDPREPDKSIRAILPARGWRCIHAVQSHVEQFGMAWSNRMWAMALGRSGMNPPRFPTLDTGRASADTGMTLANERGQCKARGQGPAAVGQSLRQAAVFPPILSIPWRHKTRCCIFTRPKGG